MQRYDRFTFTATKTDEGFIKDTPIVGRAGLLRYINADGTERIEYRPPEEAFDEKSLSSLLGKPITLGHLGMVNADNVSTVKPLGTVLTGGKQDGDAIRADIMLYSLPTDFRELSCGYTLDLEEKSGTTPDGHHYDAIQRNIRYNHVALVERGRAGIARLNMDMSQDEERTVKMTKIRVDSGIEYDAAEEVRVYVDKLRNDAERAKKDFDTLQAKYDTALSDLEKTKKEMSEAEDKAKEKFDEAVKARVELLSVAEKHKVENADSMTDEEVKIAIIKKVRGDNFNLDGKSAEYIQAAFDLCKADEAKHEDAMSEQRKAVTDGKEEKHEDKADTPEAALSRLMEFEANLYMKGGNN